MRFKFTLFLVVLFFATIFTLHSESIFAKLQMTSPSSEAASLRVAEHVLYESVFRLDLSFRRKALEQQLGGQPVTGLKYYFKDEIGLTHNEDVLLRQIAIEYLEEMQPVEARAFQIIADFRERFPDGHLPEGNEAPPPPPELVTLQELRNTVALNGRDKLSRSLGESRFRVFDQFLKTRFAENFQSIGPSRRQ